MIIRQARHSDRSTPENGICLNRFWTTRRPGPEVLDRIAETLGPDLESFGGDPRAVIGVVRVLTQGRKFKMSEQLTVLPERIPGLIEKAKNLK